MTTQATEHTAPRNTAKAARRRFSPLSVLEALATPHGVDRYLELVNPMLTVRELRAVVTDVRHGSHDTTTLTLKPTRQWRGFRAGQFVSVTVEIDGVRRTRCYSPANPRPPIPMHTECCADAVDIGRQRG